MGSSEGLTIIQELGGNEGLIVWLCYITSRLPIRIIGFFIRCELILLSWRPLRPMLKRLLCIQAGERR